MPLLTVLEYSHAVVAEVLLPGEVAVDATVGNGHDTLFLAQKVGPQGKVYGFDIQERALAAAERRLRDAGVHRQVQLFLSGHERLKEVLPREEHGRVKAVMFNLGYLPGGDKGLVTQPGTTIQALTAALDVLAPGGRISVVAYPGHPTGQVETEELLTFSRRLDQRLCHVLCYQFLNQVNSPPLLLVFEKRV